MAVRSDIDYKWYSVGGISSSMASLTAVLFCVVLVMYSQETSANLGSADNIANEIGRVLAKFMAKWFDKDAIEKIYSTQSYDTFTGEYCQNFCRETYDIVKFFGTHRC